MKVTKEQIVVVDITGDDVSSYGDDDDNQYVYQRGGYKEDEETLVIGNLHIKMTAEQEEKLRYYFQNT